MLACRGTKWRHIEFEYPALEKRYFDDFVTRTSFALRAYQDVGCGFWCTRRVPSRCHRAEPQDLGVSSPWSTTRPVARIAFLKSVASASKSPPIKGLTTNSRLISAASKLPKQHNAEQRTPFFNAIDPERRLPQRSDTSGVGCKAEVALHARNDRMPPQRSHRRNFASLHDRASHQATCWGMVLEVRAPRAATRCHLISVARFRRQLPV